MAPDTQWVTHAQGSMNLVVDWLLTGEASVAMDCQSVVGGGEQLSGGARIQVKDSGIIATQMEFSCISPRVIATGPGHHSAEWLIRPGSGQPLVGTQMLAYTVMLPRWVKRLEVVTSLRGVVRGFLNFPVGTVQAEVNLEVDLVE